MNFLMSWRWWVILPVVLLLALVLLVPFLVSLMFFAIGKLSLRLSDATALHRATSPLWLSKLFTWGMEGGHVK